ncbi:hypothetical protein ACFRFL_38855 [Streptomyces sp. NPDC056708]|uniref:hypothetical protein n=1 Tax=unclassified Streptomyces TaxID=2593676 RepID=UPI00368825F5
MIKWCRDGGQAAAEYVGPVLVVVAIVIGLVALGIGGEVAGGFRSAICEVTGSACTRRRRGGGW